MTDCSHNTSTEWLCWTPDKQRPPVRRWSDSLHQSRSLWICPNLTFTTKTPNIWKHICQDCYTIFSFVPRDSKTSNWCLSVHGTVFLSSSVQFLFIYGQTETPLSVSRAQLFSVDETGLSALLPVWDPWAVLLWMGTVTSLEPACADPEGNSVESVCSH